MEKLDLKKDQKHLYAPSAKALALVEVPAMNFLLADGAGDPNTAPAFHEAMEAMYTLMLQKPRRPQIRGVQGEAV